MQNAKPMQFVVTSRSEIWATSHGNLYLECETDRGTVAFWGKTENTRNIDSVESKVPPFSVSCEVIDGRWPQHRYWVMESKRLTFGRPMPAGSKVLRVPDFSAVRTKPGDVSADELNQWRRRLLRLLDRLFGAGEPRQGPISRITELKRDGRIPRKTAALMIAVTEVRNASEHPGEQPTPSESLAARSAWEAVTEWAMLHGIDPNSL